jgi:hypothetical protein
MSIPQPLQLSGLNVVMEDHNYSTSHLSLTLELIPGERSLVILACKYEIPVGLFTKQNWEKFNCILGNFNATSIGKKSIAKEKSKTG